MFNAVGAIDRSVSQAVFTLAGQMLREVCPVTVTLLQGLPTDFAILLPSAESEQPPERACGDQTPSFKLGLQGSAMTRSIQHEVS